MSSNVVGGEVIIDEITFHHLSEYPVKNNQDSPENINFVFHHSQSRSLDVLLDNYQFWFSDCFCLFPIGKK